eukprot:m.240553 g.240553  ORF g.240553 m.240553 type:complete len:54 (-) comp19417_c0_seq1:547-708(-)
MFVLEFVVHSRITTGSEYTVDTWVPCHHYLVFRVFRSVASVASIAAIAHPHFH